MKRILTSAIGLGSLLILFGTSGMHAAEAPPSYSLQFLGEGSVVAINNRTEVIGLRTHPTTGVQTPLVSVSGAPWTVLPTPAGATAAFPTDLNDAGVIVGVATLPGGRRAIRWSPSDSGYSVELLPLLTGELASYATGINNLGEIVGARAGILGTPFGFGWFYSDAGGLVGLDAAYGWFATPDDINDAGVILAATQTFDTHTGTLTDVGLSGPANYNPVTGVDINAAGQIVGSASLRSTSLNVVSVFHYQPGAGWTFLSGSSRYTVANDINNLGDIGWGELGAGISFAGLGNYALGNLLDPATAAAGWTITGNGCVLNDLREVATVARNSVTGQSGAVLLLPSGSVAPPDAPTDLLAIPHPATASEPYVAINLSWSNGDLLRTRTYELERRAAGEPAWTAIPLVPPAMSTSHQDTSVAPATLYEYRVRAVGVAGPGPWSIPASATSPATALDTARPIVTILTPAPGATVSGLISVSAQATDNVGVASLEIRYWNQYLGQEIILGSVSQAGSLTVNWETSGLTPAPYSLRAFAQDAVGNWAVAEISVQVTAPPSIVRVTNIALTGKTQGSRATITGTVFVKNALGAAVGGASVMGQWKLPNGSTRTSTVSTDSAGRATFNVSSVRGTYTLTVVSVTKAGFVFDAAGSVLSKSIRK